MAVLIVIVNLFCVETFANSAEPPSLVVILRNAPPGASVSSIDVDSNGIELEKKGRYKQFNCVNYFVFYRTSVSFLHIKLGNESFIVNMPHESTETYERYIAVDFRTRSASVGEHSIRSNIFTVLRVMLTLVIEVFIFKLFGFKERRSWFAFLFANVLTQTALFVAINGNINPFWGYSYLTLAFYELVIIIAECVIFKLFIKENRNIILYTILANMLSWHVGGVGC